MIIIYEYKETNNHSEKKQNSGFLDKVIQNNLLVDVKVHYNSPKPAEFGAFAFTKGNAIHLGPGQENYLEHELKHVVQQRQGRVPVTGYENGEVVNTSKELENESEFDMIRNTLLSSNPVKVMQFVRDDTFYGYMKQGSGNTKLQGPHTISYS